MNTLLSPRSPFRIFAFSVAVTLGSLAAALMLGGASSAFLVAVLIVIEVTFSFDNAIINARVLATMSPFWQKAFMTIGMLIAVFGMRLIFPVLVVMLTAGLSWNDVISLATHDPERYAHELDKSHLSISAFGGMFLLMLALNFFFDVTRSVHWLHRIEKPLQRAGRWWLGAAVSFTLLLIIIFILPTTDTKTVLPAGVFGIGTYLAVHGLSELFSKSGTKAVKQTGGVVKTGAAGLAAFLYLEVLDASFSFDGVIGAFAVTQDVIIIAVGLGVGALWVRSLTLFMVRRKTLHAYRFLEHGAHYTIGLLAAMLLLGLFFKVPEAVAGIAGICIITASIVSSVKMNRAT